MAVETPRRLRHHKRSIQHHGPTRADRMGHNRTDRSPMPLALCACGAPAPGEASSLDSWAMFGAGGLALRHVTPCSAE